MGFSVKELEKIEDLGGGYNPNESKALKRALYKHKGTGELWFVKETRTPAHAQNEVLAQKLYALAGVPFPEMHVIEGEENHGKVASKYLGRNIKGISLSDVRDGTVTGLYENFAVDCWLANWDVIGGYTHFDDIADNVYDINGKAWRLDCGGALFYRGFGSLKGDAFGNAVTEFDNFLNGINPVARRWFIDIQDEHIKEGIFKVATMGDATIRKTVMDYAPGNVEQRAELAEKLLTRKENMVNRFRGLFSKAEMEQIEGSREDRASKKDNPVDNRFGKEDHLLESVRRVIADVRHRFFRI